MDRVAVQINSPKTLASASNAVPLEVSQKLEKVHIGRSGPLNLQHATVIVAAETGTRNIVCLGT